MVANSGQAGCGFERKGRGWRRSRLAGKAAGWRFTPYASDSLTLSSETYYNGGKLTEKISSLFGNNLGDKQFRLGLNDTMETVSEKLEGLVFNEGDGSSFTLSINGARLLLTKPIP